MARRYRRPKGVQPPLLGSANRPALDIEMDDSLDIQLEPPLQTVPPTEYPSIAADHPVPPATVPPTDPTDDMAAQEPPSPTDHTGARLVAIATALAILSALILMLSGVFGIVIAAPLAFASFVCGLGAAIKFEHRGAITTIVFSILLPAVGLGINIMFLFILPLLTVSADEDKEAASETQPAREMGPAQLDPVVPPTTRPVAVAPEPRLAVTSWHWRHVPGQIVSYTEVIGEVRNDGSATADSVRVVASFYDAQGNILETDSTYTDPSSVGPNERVPFKMYADYCSQAQSCRIVLEYE